MTPEAINLIKFAEGFVPTFLERASADKIPILNYMLNRSLKVSPGLHSHKVKVVF